MGEHSDNNITATSYKRNGHEVFTVMTPPDRTQTSAYAGQVQDNAGSASNCCVKIFKDMAIRIRGMLGNTKITVHFLVCVFAIASWIDINGMWAELPILTQYAAEKWTLPSYIIVISQIANIGPILFVLVSYFAPQTKPRLEKVTSFLIIVISMVASFLMAFFWNHQSYIGGADHNTALLALSFFLAVGDCTSSLSFYAFMSHLKQEYMASLFIGEGLSGMLPALIALGQGAGDVKCNGTQQLNVEPDFSIKIYFIIVSIIILFSAVSFLLLNFWGYCKSEMIDHASPESGKFVPDSQRDKTSSYGSTDTQDLVNKENENIKYASENQSYEPCFTDSSSDAEVRLQKTSVDVKGSPPDQSILNSQSISGLIQIHDIPLWKFFFLLGMIVVINMTLTTFLSTIQIYSVLPYGLEYYHLVTTLTMIANPVTCFFALFVMAENVLILVMVTLLGQVCVAYITYLAAMSPEPPLHGQSEGGEISVAIWILVTIFLTYAKVCIAGVLRKHGRNALIWAGVATQTGTLIGAIVGFLLVNHYNLFISAPWCP